MCLAGCYRPDMNHAPDALVLDFVEWIAAGPRRYRDVMEAWKTSCPRLTIWEDAIDQGLVQRCRIDGELSIETTEAGRDLLALRAAIAIRDTPPGKRR